MDRFVAFDDAGSRLIQVDARDRVEADGLIEHELTTNGRAALRAWEAGGKRIRQYCFDPEYRKWVPVEQFIPKSKCPACKAWIDDYDQAGVQSCPQCGYER